MIKSFVFLLCLLFANSANAQTEFPVYLYPSDLPVTLTTDTNLVILTVSTSSCLNCYAEWADFFNKNKLDSHYGIVLLASADTNGSGLNSTCFTLFKEKYKGKASYVVEKVFTPGLSFTKGNARTNSFTYSYFSPHGPYLILFQKGKAPVFFTEGLYTGNTVSRSFKNKLREQRIIR